MANLCGEGYAMHKDDSAFNKRLAAIQPRVSEMSQEQLDRRLEGRAVWRWPGFYILGAFMLGSFVLGFKAGRIVRRYLR